MYDRAGTFQKQSRPYRYHQCQVIAQFEVTFSPLIGFLFTRQLSYLETVLTLSEAGNARCD